MANDDKPRIPKKGNVYGTAGGGGTRGGGQVRGTRSESPRSKDNKVRGTRIESARVSGGKPTGTTGGTSAPARRGGPDSKGSGGSFAPYPNGFQSSSRAAAQARDMRQARMERAEREAAEQEPEGFSFVDALMKALGMVGGDESSSSGGGGVDYAGLRGQLNAQAGEADSRIGAMYRQLQDSYAADAPEIQKNYTDTGASLNAASDQAAGNVGNAYQSARDAQTKQLEALGIGDAAAVLADRGGAAAQDQGQAVANIEQNRAASVNQNTARAQSAGDFNTSIGQAAGLEGNLQRANIQAQLAAKLAELGIREQEQNAQMQESRSSNSSQNFSQAMQLVDLLKADYDQQNPQEQAPDPSDQQALAEFLYQQQQDTAASQRGAQNDRNKLYLSLLKQFDGDTDRADAIFRSMIG